MDDSAIVDMFIERDEQAIIEARQKYGKRLHTAAKNILSSFEDAEECVSDALMKAWQAIPPARPTMLGAWLAKIVRNLAINMLESRNAAKRGGGETSLILDELTHCIPGSPSPEKIFEANQTAAAINAFLQAQTKQSRTVFVLRYFYAHSINDISVGLKISESKAKSMLHRMRKKLSKKLKSEGAAV